MDGNWDSAFTDGCDIISDLDLHTILLFILTSLFRLAISTGTAIPAVSETQNLYSRLILDDCWSRPSIQIVIFRRHKLASRMDHRDISLPDRILDLMAAVSYQCPMGISFSLLDTHCTLLSFVLPSTNADMILVPIAAKVYI